MGGRWEDKKAQSMTGTGMTVRAVAAMHMNGMGAEGS